MVIMGITETITIIIMNIKHTMILELKMITIKRSFKIFAIFLITICSASIDSPGIVFLVELQCFTMVMN